MIVEHTDAAESAEGDLLLAHGVLLGLVGVADSSAREATPTLETRCPTRYRTAAISLDIAL